MIFTRAQAFLVPGDMMGGATFDSEAGNIGFWTAEKSPGIL